MDNNEVIYERLFQLAKKFFGSLKNLAHTLDIAPPSISNYKEQGIAENTLLKLKTLGFNIDWLMTGEGEMRIEKPVITEFQGVPFYNLDVSASIISAFNDIPEQPEFYINFKPLNHCDAYFPVFGDSMYPHFCSGEIVGVKKLNNIDVINWGMPHLIITDANANEMRAIKNVHFNDDLTFITLRSANPNYNGDINIKKENIIGLYSVKGKIKIIDL